ncbi:MAG: hypothetical protein ACRCSQ_06270, partial [Bacteroidales bacterium]
WVQNLYGLNLESFPLEIEITPGAIVSILFIANNVKLQVRKRTKIPMIFLLYIFYCFKCFVSDLLLTWQVNDPIKGAQRDGSVITNIIFLHLKYKEKHEMIDECVFLNV